MTDILKTDILKTDILKTDILKTDILKTDILKTDKQIIDTQHDYMELIYKFVIESDKEDICPIQHVRYEAIEFSKKPRPIIITMFNDFYHWIYTYVSNMTSEAQNLFFNKYGQINVLMKISEFAQHNGFDTFNEYVADIIIDFSNSKDPHEEARVYAIETLIIYILEYDILKDIIDDYEKVQE